MGVKGLRYVASNKNQHRLGKNKYRPKIVRQFEIEYRLERVRKNIIWTRTVWTKILATYQKGLAKYQIWTRKC